MIFMEQAYVQKHRLGELINRLQKIEVRHFSKKLLTPFLTVDNSDAT